MIYKMLKNICYKSTKLLNHNTNKLIEINNFRVYSGRIIVNSSLCNNRCEKYNDNSIFNSTIRKIHISKRIGFPMKTVSPFDYNDHIYDRIRRYFGIKGIAKYKLHNTSMFLYESCTDGIDVEKFFDHCKLPDTFLSWFLVTELHVWMCLVRSMSEGGKEGRSLRNCIVQRMWEDTEYRLKRLAKMSATHKKESLRDLLYHFQAAIFAYDEGLLTDDKTLTAALWRILFTFEDVEPHILETIVSYIRTQIEHLSTIDREYFLTNGRIQWKQFPSLYP